MVSTKAVLCIFIFAIWVSFARASDLAIEFTEQEKAYLQNAAPVKMCVDPDWIPFERINEQGQHEGIAADLVQLVAQRTGLKIELYPVKTWDESLAASKSKLCHIMSFINQTPARDEWLIYTEPTFYDPNIIVTREEHPFVADLRALQGESVAIPRGTMIEERIRRDYPNLEVVLADSESAASLLVSERKADIMIRSLIVAAYAIKKEGLFNLKIAGQIPEYTNQLRIGVLKDEKILHDILDKGVKTITPQEREAISNKHVLVIAQKGIDYSLVWKILAVLALVLLVSAYWIRKLNVLNKELKRLSITDKLTGVFNRVKFDDVLETEIQRSLRFRQPFGIIMLDIDYFKQVNDLHGHQAGDMVLTEMARLLQAHTRETDILGRWGGEEFMIICPQTDINGVLSLAKNLCRIIEGHTFPIVQQKTASFGVTAYQPGDQTGNLIARADAALYAAKHDGRNQVKVWPIHEE